MIIIKSGLKRMVQHWKIKCHFTQKGHSYIFYIADIQKYLNFEINIGVSIFQQPLIQEKIYNNYKKELIFDSE